MVDLHPSLNALRDHPRSASPDRVGVEIAVRSAERCVSARFFAPTSIGMDLVLAINPLDQLDGCIVPCSVTPWRLQVGIHIYPFLGLFGNTAEERMVFIVEGDIARQIAVDLLARDFLVDACTEVGRRFLPAHFLPTKVEG